VWHICQESPVLRTALEGSAVAHVELDSEQPEQSAMAMGNSNTVEDSILLNHVNEDFAYNYRHTIAPPHFHFAPLYSLLLIFKLDLICNFLTSNMEIRAVVKSVMVSETDAA